MGQCYRDHAQVPRLAHKGLLKPRVVEKRRRLGLDFQLYYSLAV